MTDQPAPDDYADTLEANMLADYVSDGTTMVDACKTLGVPLRTAYWRMERSERFREMMEAARAAGYDILANECLAIADDGSGDYVETTDRFGNPKMAVDKEHIQRSKLRIETRVKLLAKWHPHKYGEKIQIEQKSATVAIPVSDDPVAAQQAYERLMKGS